MPADEDVPLELQPAHLDHADAVQHEFVDYDVGDEADA